MRELERRDFRECPPAKVHRAPLGFPFPRLEMTRALLRRNVRAPCRSKSFRETNFLAVK